MITILPVLFFLWHITWASIVFYQKRDVVVPTYGKELEPWNCSVDAVPVILFGFIYAPILALPKFYEYFNEESKHRRELLKVKRQNELAQIEAENERQLLETINSLFREDFDEKLKQLKPTGSEEGV